LNAQDILANRKDGESIMQTLSTDFNVLKQCLKSKELWQKLSDEEKAYCVKAKAKMKANKKLQEEVSLNAPVINQSTRHILNILLATT